MKTVLSFLMVISFSLLVKEIHCNPLNIDLRADAIYEELEALGITCNPLNTCQVNETDYWLDPDNCDCDSSCSTYDTCCIDSEFRVSTNSFRSENNLECLPVHGHHDSKIFMVSSCRNDDTPDNLCFSDPEEDNDPFLMVPVTSKITGLTYKNYFCAVCNEDVDSEQLQLWDIDIWSKGIQLEDLTEPQFTYNKITNSWTVRKDESDINATPIPVTIRIEQSSKVTVKYCSSDLVGKCGNSWTDLSLEQKCRAYMAKVTVSRNDKSVTYRNPHCALCNFEDLENVQCFNMFPGVGIDAPSPDSISPFIPLVGMFVLDIKERKCGRNMIYDRFANKCRCNTKIYTRRNGQCVLKV